MCGALGLCRSPIHLCPRDHWNNILITASASNWLPIHQQLNKGSIQDTPISFSSDLWLLKLETLPFMINHRIEIYKSQLKQYSWFHIWSVRKRRKRKWKKTFLLTIRLLFSIDRPQRISSILIRCVGSCLVLCPGCDLSDTPNHLHLFSPESSLFIYWTP